MYPILTSYLGTEKNRRKVRGGPSFSERELFLESVQAVDAGVTEGAIPNPIYEIAKDQFRSALEKATKAIMDKFFYPEIWAENKLAEKEGRRVNYESPLRTFDGALDNLTMHTVPSKLVKAKKAAFDHPYAETMIALLTELEPLAKKMTDLKKPGVIVKRQPKPVEERIVGYKPPLVVGEAQKQVVALLEGVTEKAYIGLRDLILTRHTMSLDSFLKAAEGNTDRRFSPHDFFVAKRKKFPDYDGFHIVDKVVDRNEATRTWVQKANAAEILLKEATDTADRIRMHFVHKNFRKIASVVDAKGNLERSEAVEHSISLGGLRGTFIFHFKDGARFTTVNQVVESYSVHGKAFLRFPLTFHDVILAGGGKMGRPSEERMNTTFITGRS